MPNAFITNIVKPWDELSALLSRQYAFQPEVNDPIRDAGNLAIAISHYAEKIGIKERFAATESNAYAIIVDTADSWKHGKLKKPHRQCELTLASCFEFRGQSFRFIRNSITVKHASKGSHDLLALEAEAISYWIKKLSIPIQWQPRILEAEPQYSDHAALFYNPKYQVQMDQTDLQFYSKNASGLLERDDPIEIVLAIYETPSGAE